ncbi:MULTISPECIES: hypothetical protein [Pseudonocardia]|uniref:Chorismate mutase n=1 Tax=Pseudonocardia autotrophica TaxID=2074 RepID=A0A1Y2MUQ5_PSEAH|nr:MULTISPECIES: hypothetical protein [Pseudonocardia]OSY38912.1 chorismate mutase [Pseudonocardia autotrophica]TDN76168.1 chorismate mutase [Pseudonocardia autotrophica]
MSSAPRSSRARRSAAAVAVVAAIALSAGCGGDQPDPLSTGAPGAAPADGLARIVELTGERIGISERAAAAAADTGEPAPGPDSDSGSGDVAVAAAAAERAGVDVEWAARVLADQRAAADQLRDGLTRQWAERPDTRPAEQADPAQLRSELDRIDEELLAALRIAAPARAHEDCPSSLAQAAVARAEGLGDLARGALGRSLMSVCDGTPD